MHFSARTDIEASTEQVFGALADFEAWERAALRRRAEVTRSDALPRPGRGMAWDVRFRFRGKDRLLKLKLVEMEPGARLVFAGTGKLLEGDARLELMALSPRRSRLMLHLDIRPLTLGARLFLQSARLARGKIQARLNKRMAQLAAEIEGRAAETRRA